MTSMDSPCEPRSPTLAILRRYPPPRIAQHHVRACDLAIRERIHSFFEQVELERTGRSGALLIGSGSCFNQAETVKIENGREVGSHVFFVRIPRYRTGYFQSGDADAVENGHGAAGMVVSRREEDAMDGRVRVLINRSRPAPGNRAAAREQTAVRTYPRKASGANEVDEHQRRGGIELREAGGLEGFTGGTPPSGLSSH